MHTTDVSVSQLVGDEVLYVRSTDSMLRADQAASLVLVLGGEDPSVVMACPQTWASKERETCLARPEGGHSRLQEAQHH